MNRSQRSLILAGILIAIALVMIYRLGSSDGRAQAGGESSGVQKAGDATSGPFEPAADNPATSSAGVREPVADTIPPRPAELEGWVLGDGLPLAGAAVQHGGTRTVTDEDGHFQFARAKNRQPIYAEAEGWSPGIGFVTSSPLTIELTSRVEFMIDLSDHPRAVQEAAFAHFEIRAVTGGGQDQEEETVPAVLEGKLDEHAKFLTTELHSRDDDWPNYEATVWLHSGTVLRLPFLPKAPPEPLAPDQRFYLARYWKGDCEITRLQYVDGSRAPLPGLSVFLPSTDNSSALYHAYLTDETGYLRPGFLISTSSLILKSSVLTAGGNAWMPTRDDLEIAGDTAILTLLERFLTVEVQAPGGVIPEGLEIRQIEFSAVNDQRARAFSDGDLGWEPANYWQPLTATPVRLERGWTGRRLGVAVRAQGSQNETRFGPAEGDSLSITLAQYGTVRGTIQGALEYAISLEAIKLLIGAQEPKTVTRLMDTESFELRLPYGTYKLWLSYPGDTIISAPFATFELNSPQKLLEYSIAEEASPITVQVTLDDQPLAGVGVRRPDVRGGRPNQTDKTGHASIKADEGENLKLMILPSIRGRPVEFAPDQEKRLFLGSDQAFECVVHDGMASIAISTHPVRFVSATSEGFQSNLLLRIPHIATWTTLATRVGASEISVRLPAGSYRLRSDGKEKSFTVVPGQSVTVDLGTDD